MGYLRCIAFPAQIRRAFFFLREYFFPYGCSLCGTGLVNTEETWYGLCGTCRSGIERDLTESQTGESCDCCGKPLVSERRRCLSCRLGEDRAFDRVIVIFPYAGKYRRLLAAYKFGKNLTLGNYLAEKIRCVLDYSGIPPDARIVPVPPRPGKIRKTGWDQVEYLAKLLEQGYGNRNGLQVSRCVKRLPSKSQKELDRKDRRINLHGRIVPVCQVPGTSVLIDDVMTTGSTLDACAAALKKGGGETVYGLCLFYD